MMLTKFKSSDASLLSDLKAAQCPDENIEKLRQSDILTYSRLLALLGNDATDLELRRDLCFNLWHLSSYVDKRRAANPLIACLNSADSELRSAAAFACGMMSLKRTFPLVTKLATDRDQLYLARVRAIQALGLMHDARALAVLREIVADETENVGLRGDALEQTQGFFDGSSLHDYIAILGNRNADLRFWAAFCLNSISNQIDISPALEQLDRVVASDHSVPTYWGWHVDCEALAAFEAIYYRAVWNDPDGGWGRTWIISPAAEYDDFISQYRHWTETWVYTTDPAPDVSLHIDPSWLVAQMKQHWPMIAVNVREPKPHAYSVDFQLVLHDQVFIGGLHRDGYTLVLTGFEESAYEFAAWYRSLFTPDQALFLYAWADFGIELKPGVAPENIPQLIAFNDQQRSMPKTELG